MATTNATHSIFPSYLFFLKTAKIDLDTDTHKVLLLSSSWTPAPSTEYRLSDISTYEISGASGYARQTLTNPSVSPNLTDSPNNWGATRTDFDNVVFTATTSDIVARRFAIYNDSHADDILVSYGLLNSADADVTTSSGNSLSLNFNTLGVYQFTT